MENFDTLLKAISDPERIWNNSILQSVMGMLLTWLMSEWHSRKAKLNEISYYIENELIIEDIKSKENSRIKILYDETIVPRIEKMRLVVWNSGNNCIDGSDVVQCLEYKCISQFRVLQFECLKKTKSSINFNLEGLTLGDMNDGFQLIFNYLDPNDGIVFEFTHAGDLNFGSIYGEIKKMGKVRRVELPANDWRFLFSLKFIFQFVMIIAGISLYYVVSPGVLGSAFFFVGYYVYFHFFVFGSALPKIPKSLKVDELRDVTYS